MGNVDLGRYSKVQKSVFLYVCMNACNVNFALYLKKAGLASRNISLSKTILRCIRSRFNTRMYSYYEDGLLLPQMTTTQMLLLSSAIDVLA